MEIYTALRCQKMRELIIVKNQLWLIKHTTMSPLVMIVIVVFLIVIALVAYFIRDIFVICRHLTTKQTNHGSPPRNERNRGGHRRVETEQRRVAQPSSIQPQGGLQALRTQLRSEPRVLNENENISGANAPPMPNNPPAYSDVVQSSQYDPPPSYQSFLWFLI